MIGLRLLAATAFLAAAAVGCRPDDSYKQDYNPLIDDKTDPEPETPTGDDLRKEPYRPQIHFTPARNWMNDPNGMVYADGVYHLFYQYNPKGNDWGNMSWGHATSKDLVHWEEQPVALMRDDLGDIFSGSAVIDKDNTSGFGANAMVALYTSAGSDGKQQQSIAYSTDGGKNFTRYAGNPVIKNNDDNLRDPKVFWHEASKRWIMTLAKGWKMGVDIYASADLKSWQLQSTFFVPLSGRPSLQWECPDLIQMGPTARCRCACSTASGTDAAMQQSGRPKTLTARSFGRCLDESFIIVEDCCIERFLLINETSFIV